MLKYGGENDFILNNTIIVFLQAELKLGNYIMKSWNYELSKLA
jgi:hypothetical protein